ncbi:hypothetical protein TeGR_g1810 [Tetraparma gracilis]|uniref:Uncharacterized protein n=1 Tax=Tetraparma gracilis TaxID=2962635 RepID=A0ABQ6M8D8_9STRA|nr:hypothetical protein TeGR_g1810 [Tetraparma gracilis]
MSFIALLLASPSLPNLSSSVDLTAAFSKIADAELPGGTADVASVALGEALAGVISSLTLFLSNQYLRSSRLVSPPSSDEEGDATLARSFARAYVSRVGGTAESLADAEYFVSLAALQALPGVAPLIGAVAALLPYELVKRTGREKERKVEEEGRLMDKMLEEEASKKRGGWAFGKARLSPPAPPAPPPEAPKAPPVDFVEIATDATLWLSYAALSSNFGSSISSQIPLGAGFARFAEGTIFGCVCGLSSEVYKDVAYLLSDPNGRGPVVRNRSAQERLVQYGVAGLSAAFLFGVYDAARGAIRPYLNELFSGATVNCASSTDYRTCAIMYELGSDQDFSAGFQAEARSVLTSLYSLSQGGLVEFDDFLAGGRGAIVSIVSKAAQLPFFH